MALPRPLLLCSLAAQLVLEQLLGYRRRLPATATSAGPPLLLPVPLQEAALRRLFLLLHPRGKRLQRQVQGRQAVQGVLSSPRAQSGCTSFAAGPSTSRQMKKMKRQVAVATTRSWMRWGRSRIRAAHRGRSFPTARNL